MITNTESLLSQKSRMPQSLSHVANLLIQPKLRTVVEPFGETHTMMSPCIIKQVIQDPHKIFPSLNSGVDEFNNVGREERTCVD